MKTLLKPVILIMVCIILLVSSLFWGWYLVAVKPIDIVVINKSAISEKGADYRKHTGLFWMLKQQRYINENTNRYFNEKTDYYGAFLNEKKETTFKNLDQLSKVPDMVYLSDSYGDGKKDNANNGISMEEIAAVSDCVIRGSSVIGEFNIMSSPTPEIVRSEIEDIFSVEYTGWSGKYFKNFADRSDLPGWLLLLYEKEYGEKWNLTGSGLIFVSDQDELIVLKSGTDYTGSSLRLETDPKYKSIFKTENVNFYNWFEVIKPRYGSEVVANYRLSVNDNTKAILTKAGIDTVLPAVVMNNKEKKTYYFAGDFTDYTAGKKYNSFLFADLFNKTFSFDRQGDTGNFYWRFYLPFMEKVTNDAYQNKNKIARENKKSITGVQIKDNTIEIKEDGTWKPFAIKGFNINGIMPGAVDYQYTQDIAIYREWVKAIADMGGNTVRAYDLMPPAFYRSIDEHNRKNPDKKVFLFQNIAMPQHVTLADYTSTAGKEKFDANIMNTIKAVHGTGKIPDYESRKGGVYTADVSQYLLGYLVENDVSQGSIQSCDTKNQGFRYSGTYFSSDTGATPSESILAAICDKAVSYEKAEYKSEHPIGAVGNQALLPGSPWQTYANGTFFDATKITVSKDFAAGYFTAYSLQPADKMLLDNTVKYADYKDESGSFPYGGYIKTIKGLQKRYPVLIDKFGLPTNMNAREAATSINGLSEYDQGSGIVRMMKTIKKEGYLGGLIYEFTDCWNRVSDTTKPYTIPLERKSFWHNALDPEQNYGIMAVESDPTNRKEVILRETGIVDEVKLSSDETYFYVTMLLKNDIDYQKQALILGFDTYERNLGEYIYQKDLFGNSWSGMEFIVKFENQKDASLYVIPSYNAQKSKYFTAATYVGDYDFVSKLKYGNFDASNNHFYATGTSVFVRIPWASLNFADPSRKMVLSDNRAAAAIAADKSGLQTQFTNGILFSVIVSDKETKDTLYLFPATKMSTGYKVFSWEPWEKPSYKMRLKTGYHMIGRYFEAIE